MKRLMVIILFISLTSVCFAFRQTETGISRDIPAKEDTNRFELRIYPNPAETGRITLEMASAEIAEIRLINITGKEILTRKMEFGTSKYPLSLGGIPNGIYFVRVKTTEDKVFVKKLIVSGR